MNAFLYTNQVSIDQLHVFLSLLATEPKYFRFELLIVISNFENQTISSFYQMVFILLQPFLKCFEIMSDFSEWFHMFSVVM